MSEEDIRLTISRQASLVSLPAFIPICIARTESDLDPNCLGDYEDGKPTSFGLFQLHRGGLAPSDLTDDEMLNPNVNSSIACKAMLGAYHEGTAQGLDGIALLKFVASRSGWPCMLGVEWVDAHRPDYTSRLSRMYLDEMQTSEGSGSTPPAAPAAPAAPAEESPPAADQAAPARSSYTVQAGDTLSAIGLRYRVPWDVLARYNWIENPDVIQVGQVIRLPEVYRVKAGDTLSQICEDLDAGDYRNVAYFNQVNPDLIFTGMQLYL